MPLDRRHLSSSPSTVQDSTRDPGKATRCTNIKPPPQLAMDGPEITTSSTGAAEPNSPRGARRRMTHAGWR